MSNHLKTILSCLILFGGCFSGTVSGVSAAAKGSGIKYDLVVDQQAAAESGTGVFRTVQAALDAVPSPNPAPVIIYIKNGRYLEHLEIKQDNIVLVGESRDGTVIEAPERRATCVITGNNFRAENITFLNPFGQEERYQAISATGDRSVYYNCAIIGAQDTLYLRRGRYYFADCLIAGDVDFIYGEAQAVFDRCEILSVAPDGGYLTAASTAAGKPGFLFLNCRITAEPGVRKHSVYLGRPWRDDAQVTFINCRMGEHIRPQGWHNWGKPEREATARYEEYQSTDLDGRPLDLSSRVTWSRVLTAWEAAGRNAWAYLKGADGWDPAGQKVYYEVLEEMAQALVINGGQPYVTADLDLPVATTSGAKITWFSSNPALVSAGGKVERPAAGSGSRRVTLTALISQAERGVARQFELIVLPAAPTGKDDPDYLACWDAAAVLEETFSALPLAALTDDLTLPAEGFNGTAISWHSENPAVSATGVVLRPPYRAGDATGGLTARISKGQAVLDKTFPVTVLKQEYNLFYDDFKTGLQNWEFAPETSAGTAGTETGGNRGPKAELKAGDGQVSVLTRRFDIEPGRIIRNGFKLYLSKFGDLQYTITNQSDQVIFKIRFEPDGSISVFDGPDNLNDPLFPWPLYSPGQWLELTVTIDCRPETVAGGTVKYDLSLSAADGYHGPYQLIEQYTGVTGNEVALAGDQTVGAVAFHLFPEGEALCYLDDYYLEDLTAIKGK